MAPTSGVDNPHLRHELVVTQIWELDRDSRIMQRKKLEPATRIKPPQMGDLMGAKCAAAIIQNDRLIHCSLPRVRNSE